MIMKIDHAKSIYPDLYNALKEEILKELEELAKANIEISQQIIELTTGKKSSKENQNSSATSA